VSEPTIGDNSQLKSVITRIESLEENIQGFRADQKDIYAEAKSKGLDVKALRRVIAIRKMDAGKHEDFENLVDTYLHALGDV
jgi:uncharacterized protein (UPF0335 family)